MEGSLDGMIEYLNLPALQYLDISRMTSYYALEPFLTRSSPPLVSLLVRADEGCFEDWHRCVAHVANTLENLTVRQVPHEVVLDLCFGDKSLDALQNIRSLSLQEVWGGVDLYFLVDFLYLRSDKLRSFRLVWRASPFLDRICCSGPRTKQSTQSGSPLQVGSCRYGYIPWNRRKELRRCDRQ
ncbi:hypothetical protein B0H13DRAFT_896294 [Mycena leptocephala]|nr:hypothetical protein B0H13DRAFT_896294 [Mycena leptocephala]